MTAPLSNSGFIGNKRLNESLGLQPLANPPSNEESPPPYTEVIAVTVDQVFDKVVVNQNTSLEPSPPDYQESLNESSPNESPPAYTEGSFHEVSSQDQMAKDQLANNILEAVKANVGEAKASGALGGKGGTRKQDINMNGEQVNLFLKPLEESEYRNYQGIALLSQMAQHMPQIYGKIEDVQLGGDKAPGAYLVMQNTIPPGSKQLCDLKAAYETKELRNEAKRSALADPRELEATNHKKKSAFSFGHMKFFSGVVTARSKLKGWMNVEKAKIDRPRGYYQSAEKTQKDLEGISSANLFALLGSLEQIRTSFLNSPSVGFIGFSIIFVQDQQGSVKPYLIDPAHVVFGGDKARELIKEKNMYVDDEALKLYRDSNFLALTSLIQFVHEEATDRLVKETLENTFPTSGPLAKNVKEITIKR
jgi:hypothetical protein